MPEGARVPVKETAPTLEKSRSAEGVREVRPRPRHLRAQILHTQRTLGNRAVQRLVKSEIPQPGARSRPLPGRQIARAAAPPASAPKPAASTPKIQRAWYNISIPFTNYQIDPTIEGLKTAANLVKDTAEAGFDWLVEQIKSVVHEGIEWLEDKWRSLQETVESAWNAVKNGFDAVLGFIRSPLGFLGDALMNFDAQSLTRAWNTFSGLVNTAAGLFRGMTGGLLDKINGAWSFINDHAQSLLSRVAGMTDSWVFRHMPGFVQDGMRVVINGLTTVWNKINAGWKTLFGKVHAWVDDAIAKVTGFVQRVGSFAINTVVAGIVEFGKVVLFLKDLFTNPQKYLEILAQRAVSAFSGVEGLFGGMVSKYFGGETAGADTAPATKIHRSPGPVAAPAPVKTSATWSEIGHGIAGMMGKKWQEFKANPMAVIKQLLIDMVFPMLGNIKDVIQLLQDIKKIVTGPLSAGSLDELWTSLLQILDIPILIYRTVVSVVMRSLTVPLIVASFVPEPRVKAIAATVGYALLGAFVQAELLNLAQKLLLLRTGKTTEDQKLEAFNRIADSLVALAMAAAITVLMLILHFLANVAKGIYNFIKGKIIPVERPVAPGEVKAPKDAGSDSAKPDVADLGFENGKKIVAEEPTADGKHKIKVTETGECLYCTDCGILIKEYAPELDNPANKDVLADLDTANQMSNPKLKARRMAQIEERLAEIRKKNPNPIDPVASREARIRLLARDPAHSGKVTPGSLREAEVAVSLEESGQVKGPIQRDPTGAADFIDASGTEWDVKGPNSHVTPAQGGFELATDVAKIDKSLGLGENVMVDTGNMTAADVAALKAEGAKPGHNWGDRVKFYP